MSCPPGCTNQHHGWWCIYEMTYTATHFTQKPFNNGFPWYDPLDWRTV